jgi:hypothetical protein
MTEDLRKALASGQGELLRVIDPVTSATYVLVPADEYARLSGEQPIEDSYAVQEAVAHAEGWDDPQLDDYNDYDARRLQKG